MSSGGPGGFPDHPPLNGVERIAADMMAIRLPQSGPAAPHHHQLQGGPAHQPQGGPPPSHQLQGGPPPSHQLQGGPGPSHQLQGGPAPSHQLGTVPSHQLQGGRLGVGQRPQPGGWQAMPPILPPAGMSPNIPTAIVPPGVPPHGRPLVGEGRSDANALGFHGSERVEAVHPRMLEQQTRLDSRPAGAWSSGPSEPLHGVGGGGGRGAARDYPGHLQQQQQQPEGPTYANGVRTGGSGRIIPNSSGRTPSF